LREPQSFAVIHKAQRCDVPLGSVLGQGAFDLARILEREPEFLTELHEHEHDNEISSVSLNRNKAARRRIV